jgi:hypothetical protein
MCVAPQFGYWVYSWPRFNDIPAGVILLCPVVDFLEVPACMRSGEIRYPVCEQWIIPSRALFVRNGSYIAVAHENLS